MAPRVTGRGKLAFAAAPIARVAANADQSGEASRIAAASFARKGMARGLTDELIYTPAARSCKERPKSRASGSLRRRSKKRWPLPCWGDHRFGPPRGHFEVGEAPPTHLDVVVQEELMGMRAHPHIVHLA